jgi:hypothetical protein
MGKRRFPIIFAVKKGKKFPEKVPQTNCKTSSTKKTKTQLLNPSPFYVPGQI